MTNEQLQAHISLRQAEIEKLCTLWDYVEQLRNDSGLSLGSYAEIKARITMQKVYCEISIRDHKKLLTQ